ncbi:hypothetical protein SMACR_00509 [Sordaria macrospora]|uniref:WGS project CABT00000000 data, contig 2.1 n=2 Tax=Sordaria macrospora TaxID=5147 RepID=F7VLB4_SORMK|nr:uncharacterized protein SMAC_00509 [Sordaria macrospora k-hell]KAA8635412.1 hypothetical protein SMACR_00509 [Sordaria macrospora]KAH7627526.1 hypothetical protein B0T09DRAFT_347166 [Sordaria sp. MPI-SDFR-AT-0083]WPJ59259.1 hypothetical protein SMAC4_00509 [Sordaria macrospora]CCC06291.1 unnamed protein product [Sordaria macrospora k-hell]
MSQLSWSPTAILRKALRIFLPISLALTIYLYFFPFFGKCAFPLPPVQHNAPADTGYHAFLETVKLHLSLPPVPVDETDPTSTPAVTPSRPLAPFRLLALGDPQLEGDTSIPTEYLGVFPHVKSLFRHLTFQTSHASLRWRLRQCFHEIVDIFFEDVFNLAESYRKRFDHWGNDYYLAHIYRTLHWWSRPTHVTVLGDLLGSQWVTDDEFYWRAHRFWNRVFKGGERVPDDVAMFPADEYDLTGYLSTSGPANDSEVWTKRIINVAGNHDIGYAGDINTNLTGRFEDAFGKINYELRFELPLTNKSLTNTLFDALDNPLSDRLVPELRLVVLNDMNLDTPALSPELQDDTYSFINSVINTASAVQFRGHYTLILTHVPLYKPDGVCVDSPLFTFHDHDGTLKEQNQLSLAASKGFLEGILGISGNKDAPANGQGRRGIILNGHDHEGCDTWHYINQSFVEEETLVQAEDGEFEIERKQREWEVKRYKQAKKEAIIGRDDMPGVREVTVRSMMGEFGGNAGLLSVWFDEEEWEWKAEYATCPMGTQHLWWVVHFMDFFVILGAVVLAGAGVAGSVFGVDVDKAVVRGLRKIPLVGGGRRHKRRMTESERKERHERHQREGERHRDRDESGMSRDRAAVMKDRARSKSRRRLERRGVTPDQQLWSEAKKRLDYEKS